MLLCRVTRTTCHVIMANLFGAIDLRELLCIYNEFLFVTWYGTQFVEWGKSLCNFSKIFNINNNNNRNFKINILEYLIKETKE